MWKKESSKKGEEGVLPLARIKPNRFQPRREFSQAAIDELAQSIKENGIIQPIVVRVLPEQPEFFELVAGERRFRAVSALGWQEIPAIIREYTHEQSMQVALIENIQRQDLNVVEEAQAIKLLADSCLMSHEQVANKIGKSRSAVTNSIRLLSLPVRVKELLVQKKLSAGQVRPLLIIEDVQEQIRLAEEIVGKKLTARAVEKIVRDNTGSSQGNKGTNNIDPHIKKIEYDLAQELSTKVRINGSSHHGRIEIEYYSLEDLERLLEVLGVNTTGGNV